MHSRGGTSGPGTRSARRVSADGWRPTSAASSPSWPTARAARFPLTEAAAALALAESRTLNGKVVLLP
ncbi:hypothetical protein GCM10009627_27030 [Curtobacterium herbarum]|uniref:Zinc-binding dehydrogenase n=1 Tax=Curtobacterium herbarum TaxID=150122 RepID=A0ABN1ZF45_9MICO